MMLRDAAFFVTVTLAVFDDRDGWAAFRLALPLSRRDVVLGRYATTVATCLAFAVLGEETGLAVRATDMVGPLWRRDATIEFNGAVIRSEEMYFVHRTTRFEPADTGRSVLERTYIHGHRWCDATMIRNLVAGGEAVYPRQLAELLDEANALADRPDAVAHRPVHSIR